MKKSVFLISITIAIFRCLAIDDVPVNFCGIRLGSQVSDDMRPNSMTENYYGYCFDTSEKVLKFNQYQFHTTLISRTITSVGAGYTTASRGDAEKLFADTCRWLERKYPGKKYEERELPNRIIRAMCFGRNIDGYYLVELNNLMREKYVVLITLYNDQLSKLEAQEAQEFISNRMSAQSVPLQFNLQQLNNAVNKPAKIDEDVGGCNDGWTKIEIPGFVTVDVPPTLELQKGAYKIFRDAITARLNIDLCDKALVLQQSGLNSLEDGSTRRYARIIFRSIVDDDEDFVLSDSDLTPDILKQIEDDEYANTKATIKQLRRSVLGSIKLIKWYPIQKVRLGGLNGYRIAYLRQQNNNPPVYVEEYKLINGRYIHIITFSYRQCEESFWKNDYAEVKRRIRFSKTK